MPRPASIRWTLLAAILVLVLGALCMRHVGESEIAVRDSALLDAQPAVLQPGWHLAARGLFRIHRYATGTRLIPFGQPEPLRFRSPEGAGMLASGAVELGHTGDSVLALHTLAGGDFDAWLNGILTTLVYELLASPDFVPLTVDRLPDMEVEGARRLGEVLGAAGVEVVSLDFKSIGYEGGPVLTEGRTTDVARKVLWLAVDSFDWDIIEPLMEQGRMPNMARLRAEGAWGRLKTRPPLVSPVLWTSIATGMGPEKHGIVDFIATDPSTGAILPVTSTLRRTSAFWNILGDSGVSVGVVGWWASFPAEPVNGFIATDRIAYQLFKVREHPDDNPFKVYPGRHWNRVASLIKPPAEIGNDRLARFMDMDRHASRISQDDISRVNSFRTVLAATDTYLGIGRELFREHPTDVRVLYFEGPDTTAHLFMPFAPPAREGTDSQAAEAFGMVVDRYYAYQDELIGQLIEEFADEETTIIICSDHGFRTGDERPDTDSRIGRGLASDWHASDGVILLAGKDIKPGVRILGATIMDVVPTLLALYGLPAGEDMAGRVLATGIREEFLAAHPLETIPSWDEGKERRQPEFAEITQDDQELLEKLASLGYIEQDAPSARGNMALIQLQAGENQKAIELLKEVIQEEKDPEGARLILARAYRRDGQPDRARRELEILLKTDWNRADILTELAILSREARDWKGAERLFAEAVREDSDNVSAHMQLARLYEQQGRWNDALREYRRVLELQPASSQALNQIGLNLRKLGRPEEAVREFTRAIQVNPDDHFAYNNLGLLYHRMRETQKARRMLETGIVMAPENAILRNSLGTIYFESGQVDEAIGAFEKAIEIEPDYAEVLSNLAMVYKSRGDMARANEYVNRLLELDPEKSDVRITMAALLTSMDRTIEAVRLLNGLLDRDPGNFQALVSLARIFLDRGDHSRAVPLLERAGSLQGSIPGLWNDLAMAYTRVGREKDARSALRRSIGLDPDQPAIARRLAELGG